MLNRFLALSALTLLAACGPKRIPGTDIDDTRDSRAILQVMEKYRAGVEARDTSAILALVAPDFRDDAGTPNDPEDDLNAANLKAYLEALFPKLQSTKVEMNVRRVNVQGNVATAIYYWNASWRMPGLNPRAQQDSELEQMVLRKIDGQWKIVSGV